MRIREIVTEQQSTMKVLNVDDKQVVLGDPRKPGITTVVQKDPKKPGMIQRGQNGKFKLNNNPNQPQEVDNEIKAGDEVEIDAQGLR